MEAAEGDSTLYKGRVTVGDWVATNMFRTLFAAK
jgi:hypothetical protein